MMNELDSVVLLVVVVRCLLQEEATKLLDRKSGLAEAVTPEIASKDDR